MTRHQARRERRAAERKAKKAEEKRNRTLVMPVRAHEPCLEPEAGFVSQIRTRAEINRANAQRSTGPHSSEGKLASSGNSLKHGLASGKVIIPGEDPAAFEALLRDLLEEHQPANATEEILVNEMAQSYWLTQRAIRLQNECFTEEGIDEKRLALFLRYQTTHDRAFHKSMSALLRLRRGRACPALGFVSQAGSPDTAERNRAREQAARKTGFVSQTHGDSPRAGQFVSQNAPDETRQNRQSLVEAA